MIVPIRRAVLDIRREEWPLALRMASYFFLVITSFWILKPLKMFVALVAVAVFSRLSLRHRRERLSSIVTIFFLVGYIAFAVLLAHPVPSPGVVWSFYLFGDLFSTLMVATFFAFLDDSLDPQAAKRQLGLIGLGGVAGGFFGSSILRTFIDSLTIPAWLCVTSVFGVAILFLARSAGRRVSRSHDRRVVG